MLERNRSYLVEGFKSMLIFLLALFAVYLAGKAFMLYDTGSHEIDTAPLPTASTGSLGNVGVSRPVRMAVVNSSGRYGAQYDDTDVDAMFDALGDLLGEALGSAETAVPVSREVWEAALLSQGVYYDFPGRVSLRLVSAWLGEGETSLNAQASGLLLATAAGSDVAELYYVDANDGGYYACDTQVQFRQRLDGYTPNGAFFAFQQPERYGGLNPDTMILPDVPVPPVYKSAAGANVQDSDVLETLLDALSFSPQPNAIYPAADGWTVREAEDSLRLTRNGNIYYQAGDNSDRYPVSPSVDENELVEVTGELIRLVMAPYSGTARIYLDEIKQVGASWVLTYRYTLSGADVQLGQDGWCAQFTVKDGQISEYILKLRRYETTGETAVLLPEYQAMHAMEAMDAEGRRLLLRYYDGGSGTVSPSWIAR